MNLKSFLIKFVTKFKSFEKYAIFCFLKSEGGYIRSKSLRALFKQNYRIEVGMFSYGCFTRNFNFGGGKIKVGRYCSIASGCVFLGANHPIDNFSTSPIFYNKSLGYDVKDIERHDLTIEDDVWIGINTIITCGCTKIGRGSIIGAGSVVTKDVEPYTIVGGIPAKVIRKRFSEDRINELEQSKWWLKAPESLLKESKNEIYEQS